MARAKRTERAEARRRYRAAVTADPATDTIDGDAPSAGSRSGELDGSASSRASSGDKAGRPAGWASARRSGHRSGR